MSCSDLISYFDHHLLLLRSLESAFCLSNGLGISNLGADLNGSGGSLSKVRRQEQKREMMAHLRRAAPSDIVLLGSNMSLSSGTLRTRTPANTTTCGEATSLRACKSLDANAIASALLSV